MHNSLLYYRQTSKKSNTFRLLPRALTARLSTLGFYTGQRLEFSLGAILQPFFMDTLSNLPWEKEKKRVPEVSLFGFGFLHRGL